MTGLLHNTQKINFLKTRIQDSPEYIKNIFDLEKYFFFIDSKIIEHINKINNVDLYDITQFAGAKNYSDLLDDYNSDITYRLDSYAKFLIHVYSCCINHNVDLNSFEEINDIYNIKYNFYIQQSPSVNGFGINLEYN